MAIRTVRRAANDRAAVPRGAVDV